MAFVEHSLCQMEGAIKSFPQLAFEHFENGLASFCLGPDRKKAETRLVTDVWLVEDFPIHQLARAG